MWRFFVFIILSLIISCSKRNITEETNVLQVYFSDSTNYISDTVFVIDRFVTLDQKLKKVNIPSFIENRNITFEITEDAVKDFIVTPKELGSNFYFQKINFNKDFFNLKKETKGFTFITKPIFSINKKYSLVEIGNRNIVPLYNNPLYLNEYKENVSFDLILYKKERGIWKQIELIHKRNLPILK